MGLIEFSHTRKYRIMVWSFVGCGVLFFLIGIILVSSLPKDVKATAIIPPSNLIEQDDYCILDVCQKQTPLRFSTTPNSSTAPIHYKITAHGEFASITGTTYKGSAAILELKTYDGLFAYTTYSLDDLKLESNRNNLVSIDVTCGSYYKKIYVRILLPCEHTSLNVSLVETIYNDITEDVESIQEVKTINYANYLNGAKYILVVDFKILGKTVYTLALDRDKFILDNNLNEFFNGIDLAEEISIENENPQELFTDEYVFKITVKDIYTGFNADEEIFIFYTLVVV